MINCTFCLWQRVEKFYSTKFSKEKDFPTRDILLENNWNELEIFKNLLYLFYFLIMRLQINSKTRLYKLAWEYLVAIDIIKKHLKKAKAEYAKG